MPYWPASCQLLNVPNQTAHILGPRIHSLHMNTQKIMPPTFLVYTKIWLYSLYFLFFIFILILSTYILTMLIHTLHFSPLELRLWYIPISHSKIFVNTLFFPYSYYVTYIAFTSLFLNSCYKTLVMKLSLFVTYML